MTMQPASVLFPDIELWATGYLRTALAAREEPYAANVWVDNKKPSTNKARIVAVRRDGGAQVGLRDFPRLTVRVWADKEQDASDLSRLVCALMVNARGSGHVANVGVIAGPMGVPDSAQPQKFMTFEVTTRSESDL